MKQTRIENVKRRFNNSQNKKKEIKWVQTQSKIKEKKVGKE